MKRKRDVKEKEGQITIQKLERDITLEFRTKEIVI